MSIEVSWADDEQMLIQVALISPWDWPDLEVAMDQALEMICPVGHTVYFLIDFARSVRPPRGNSLLHLKRVMLRTAEHPLAGDGFLVNPNPFARSVIELLLRLYKDAQSLHIVKDREEALRWLATYAGVGAASQKHGHRSRLAG